MRTIVVDTNILFSALLKESSLFARLILAGDEQFVVNELVLTELFRHKEKIARLSQLHEDDVVLLYYKLIRSLELYKEELLSPRSRSKAYQLCKGIDETDAPHVAIALELDGWLWTGDKRLKRGLRERGFDRLYVP